MGESPTSRVPRSPVPRGSRRLPLLGVAALAVLLLATAPAARQATPAPGVRPGGLQLTADEPLTLTLSGRHGSSWAQAGALDLSVRSAGGLTRPSATALPAGPQLRLDGPAEGCSLVTVRLGNGAFTASKTVTCRAARTLRDEARSRMAAGSFLMMKTGGRVELRPFANPATTIPGADLPVRVYSHAGPPPGAEAVALGPGGRRLRAGIDAVGVATFRIDAPGRWTVRYVERHDDVEEIAELHFHTAPPGVREAWRRILEEGRADPRRPSQPGGEDAWVELGPRPIAGSTARPGLFSDTGRVAALAASHRNRGLIFAGGAGGGVWRTGNGGRRWRALTDSLPITTIGAVALHPGNHRIVYAGSGEANYAYHSVYGLGLYRSTNRGRTWEVIAPETFAGRTFSRLAVSHGDPDVVFAAVGRAGGRFGGLEAAKEHPDADGPVGLFRSDDGGDTWEQVTRGLRRNVAATDVVIDPVDADRVFVALGDTFGHRRNGIYRSDDGGRRFRRLAGGLPRDDFGRASLAVAAGDPDRVYALVAAAASHENPGGFAPGGADVIGFFRSDDGGDTWRQVGPAPPFDDSFQFGGGYYYTAVGVHPTDPDIVFAGGVEMFRSTDGGVSWTTVTPPHVDIHDLEFDAAGRLLVADDGGVHRSADLGDSWTELTDFGSIQFYPGISFTPLSPGLLLGGTQDNGTVMRLGREWLRVFGGDGGYTAIDPGDPDVLLYEFQGTGNLFRSTDGGFSSVRSDTGIVHADRNAFLPPFQFDPGDPSRLLYATHRIYESLDGGVSWTPISGDLTGGPPAAVRSLAMAPSDPGIVYAGTNDGRIMVSRDGGRSWTRSLGGVVGWPRVERELAVDPGDAETALLATMRFGDRRLLLTEDGGGSWRAVDGDLPDTPVNTAAIHRDGAVRYLFAGTDAGVWLSTDGGGSWERLGRDLPNVPVMDLRVDVDSGTLWAATLGRGAWSIPLPE